MESDTLLVFDIENVITNVSELECKNIDFNKIVDFVYELTGSLNVDAVAFMSYNGAGFDKRRKLAHFMAHNGIAVIRKHLKRKTGTIKEPGGTCRSYAYTECDMDSHIATFILAKGDEYGTIVLVSGDSDLHIPLSILDNNGARIVVISHKESIKSGFDKFEFHSIKEAGCQN